MGTGMEEKCERMGCFFSSQGWGPENRAENLKVAGRDEDERRENMQEQTRGDRAVERENQRERKGEGGPMGVAKCF